MSCIPLTPEDRAALTERLREAENAYHQLAIGGQARTFVDQNGERVEYTPASANRLRSYIAELRTTLGLPLRGISGPLQVWMIP